MERCPWVPEGNDLYARYHDEEWGVPAFDDRKLFEFLVLESAQAGLSWITILKKRPAYREAFAGFDPEKVAAFDQKKVGELLRNPGIVRNRRKIEAAINNAQRFLEVRGEFGTFAAYMWRFVGGGPIQHHFASIKDYPVSTPESEAMSRDMKERGFAFLGPVICYAHMQAVGMVNDHTASCFRHRELTEWHSI
jgi:DNA-3-methyladenine glycosylase I